MFLYNILAICSIKISKIIILTTFYPYYDKKTDIFPCNLNILSIFAKILC